MSTFKPDIQRCRPLSILVFIAAVLSSMAVSADNNLTSIRIQSLMDFNAILITEVDVVFVYDQAVAEQLPTSKGEWYGQKYDLLKDDPAELDVVTMSIPQGFDSAFVILPEQAGSAVSIFAVGYHEGQDVPVHDMTDLEDALIQIDQFGIRVSAR